MKDPFKLLEPAQSDENARGIRKRVFAERSVHTLLTGHTEAAPRFVPSMELVAAVNVALNIGAPLLLTGEPGTGKTQVAHYLAWYFGLTENLFQFDVRSSSTAADLIYSFDSVAYFHAAQSTEQRDQPLRRDDFVRPGPIWRAFEMNGAAIVLLDEIDKAPRDFPNDILGVLDQYRFYVPEQDRTISKRPGSPPPLVVITSNSERRLPEPFLRRCVFHHIELTPALLMQVVKARRDEFPNLDDTAVDAAIERLWELRGRGLRKAPATAELLAWLMTLSLQGGMTADQLRELPLSGLPGLCALVKDHEDMGLL